MLHALLTTKNAEEGVMESQLKQWRDDLKHLPEFMRDFHKCKNLFRGVEDVTLLDDDHPARQVNCRQAHC